MASTADAAQVLILSEEKVEGKVSLNGLVAVAVEETPSTGYHWVFELAAGTPGLLHTLSDTFVPGGKMVGESGVRVFLFRAERKGSAGVMFRLYPFGQTEPTNEFTCSIEIRKSEN
jgi:predicted secreted protein